MTNGEEAGVMIVMSDELKEHIPEVDLSSFIDLATEPLAVLGYECIAMGDDLS